MPVEFAKMKQMRYCAGSMARLALSLVNRQYYFQENNQMKQAKNILTALCVVFLFNACSKQSEEIGAPNVLATAPEANVANNSSSKGIYKGVFIGSTGTIKFDIGNNGTSITGLLVIDGVRVDVTSTTVPQAGMAYSGQFKGTLNGGAVSFTFNVDADGKNASVTSIVIPGHPNAAFLLAKESSTALVEAYVGTYQNVSSVRTEKGTFNMVVSRSTGVWTVLVRADGAVLPSTDGGKISGNDLYDTSNKKIGTLNADGTLTGTFTNSNTQAPETTTISGKRSL